MDLLMQDLAFGHHWPLKPSWNSQQPGAARALQGQQSLHSNSWFSKQFFGLHLWQPPGVLSTQPSCAAVPP